MNIYEMPPLPLTSELLTVLVNSGRVRVERIVSCGQVSDWYDQAESEFVALIEGEAEIEFENGRAVRLGRGDTMLIKPHERHRVSYTSSEPACIWLCVFF